MEAAHTVGPGEARGQARALGGHFEVGKGGAQMVLRAAALGAETTPGCGQSWRWAEGGAPGRGETFFLGSSSNCPLSEIAFIFLCW